MQESIHNRERIVYQAKKDPEEEVFGSSFRVFFGMDYITLTMM